MMQDQNQQIKDDKKRISSIKKMVLKNFEDALKKIETIKDKISSISALKNEIKNSTNDGLEFVKGITGLNDPDEIKKLVELEKETLDKVNLSLYTLRSVKNSTQELNNDLDLKDVSENIFKFVGNQDKLLMLWGEGALAEIEKKIKDTHTSREQKKQLTQQKNEIGQSLGSLKKSLDGVDKNEIEKFKTALKNQMNSFYNSASYENFHLFKAITNVLKTQMEQFKTDIQEILDSIGNDQNKKDIKNFLAGLVFCDECEQFDNFAYNLQHFDQISSDDWNERSMFNMKCDKNGKLERGGAGLNNIGATCYMNATLQSLRHLKSFNKAFKNYGIQQKSLSRATAEIDMTHEMIKLVKELDNKVGKSISPYDFKEKLSEANPLFAGIAANDSKDLINFLIEKMHGENNLIKTETYQNITIQQQTDENFMRKTFQEGTRKNYKSFVSDAIYGMWETKSCCSGCKITKYNFQVYSFLEFPLEQVNIYCCESGLRPWCYKQVISPAHTDNRGGVYPEVARLINSSNGQVCNPDIDLDECFKYFSKMDLMVGGNQMYCNFCNCLNDSQYQTVLESLPNDLIINLNRGKGAVYECKVNFPDYFDCYKSGTRVGKFRFKSLNSIICHLGPSSMSGHFIAYARSIYNGQWYQYNDGVVTKMSGDIFKGVRQGMPYILFYQGMGGEEMLNHVLSKVTNPTLKLKIQDSFDKLADKEMLMLNNVLSKVTDPTLKLEIQKSFGKVDKEMLNNVLSKVTDPTLKLEIQKSFGKWADAVERQERFSYLLMCAAESNLGKDKKPTLSPKEISNLIQLAYNMIKDRNDLLDDNRMEVYRNAIDTFISTRGSLSHVTSKLEWAMQQFGQFRQKGDQECFLLCENCKKDIIEKFSEMVLKRPQDMQTFTSLLCRAANYTNLDAYDQFTLVELTYKMIKDRNDLSDGNRRKLYENAIDTFITTRDNFLNKFIIAPLTANANQFEQNGNSQQANLLKSYARAIDAKFNEIVLKRPQDMHMFVNLLQCAASCKTLSPYNWSSLVCAVYEIIKSDTKLSDTVPVKYWNSQNNTWVYYNPLNASANIYNSQPDKTYRERYYKQTIRAMANSINNSQTVTVNIMLQNVIKNNFTAPYALPTLETQPFLDGWNQVRPQTDQQGNAIGQQVFVSGEKIDTHIRLYGKDSPLLNANQMLKDVLDRVTDQLCCNAINKRFKELQTNPEEQKRFIYSLAYPCINYNNMNKSALSNLICVIYEMVRAEKDLCDDSLIWYNSTNYKDRFNIQYRQELCYNRMDRYKYIIDETATVILNNKETVSINNIAEYINSQFKVTSGKISQVQPNLNMLTLDKEMNINPHLYQTVDCCVQHEAYKKAISDKYEELQSDPAKRKIFADLMSYPALKYHNNRDFVSLSNLICAVYEMIKNDDNLSNNALLKDFDNNQQANCITREQHYKNIIDKTAEVIGESENVPVINIVKYMNSHFKIASGPEKENGVQNQQQNQQQIFEINKPMNIELYNMDSPMTAQEMIGDVLNRLSNSAYQAYATAIKSCFGSLKYKPKEQKKLAYLLLRTGVNSNLTDINFCNFTCATFEAIRGQFALNKFQSQEHFIDIKANEKMIDDVTDLVCSTWKVNNQTVSIAAMQNIFNQQKNNQIINQNNNLNNIKNNANKNNQIDQNKKQNQNNNLIDPIKQGQKEKEDQLKKEKERKEKEKKEKEEKEKQEKKIEKQKKEKETNNNKTNSLTNNNSQKEDNNINNINNTNKMNNNNNNNINPMQNNQNNFNNNNINPMQNNNQMNQNNINQNNNNNFNNNIKDTKEMIGQNKIEEITVELTVKEWINRVIELYESGLKLSDDQKKRLEEHIVNNMGENKKLTNQEYCSKYDWIRETLYGKEGAALENALGEVLSILASSNNKSEDKEKKYDNNQINQINNQNNNKVERQKEKGNLNKDNNNKTNQNNNNIQNNNDNKTNQNFNKNNNKTNINQNNNNIQNNNDTINLNQTNINNQTNNKEEKKIEKEIENQNEKDNNNIKINNLTNNNPQNDNVDIDQMVKNSKNFADFCDNLDKQSITFNSIDFSREPLGFWNCFRAFFLALFDGVSVNCGFWNRMCLRVFFENAKSKGESYCFEATVQEGSNNQSLNHNEDQYQKNIRCLSALIQKAREKAKKNQVTAENNKNQNQIDQ